MGPKCLELMGTSAEEYQLRTKLKNMTELLSLQRVKMLGALSKAIWCQELKLAEVTEKVGPYWDTMGHSEHGKIYLYPEEALFLMDIGGLELSFGGVPLSLQRAYILLLNNSTFTMDQYKVYSYLSLLGYNVQRHSKTNIFTKYEKDIEIHKIGIKVKKFSNRKQVETSSPDSNATSNYGVILSEDFRPIEGPVMSSSESIDNKMLIDSAVSKEELPCNSNLGKLRKTKEPAVPKVISCHDIPLKKRKIAVVEEENLLNADVMEAEAIETDSTKNCSLENNAVPTITDFCIKPGESDESVLSRLQVISPAEFLPDKIDSNEFIHMDVYLYDSKIPFRKSNMQRPDYRLRVVSKDDPVPDVAFITILHQHFQDEVPIIYAVVHPDCIQFLQLGPVTLPKLF